MKKTILTPDDMVMVMSMSMSMSMMIDDGDVVGDGGDGGDVDGDQMIPVFPFAALRRKLSFTPSQPTVTESSLGIANKDHDLYIIGAVRPSKK